MNEKDIDTMRVGLKALIGVSRAQDCLLEARSSLLKDEVAESFKAEDIEQRDVYEILEQCLGELKICDALMGGAFQRLNNMIKKQFPEQAYED